MKKVISTILAMALATTMSITAFAAESPATITTNNGAQSIGVKAKTVDDVTTPEVISVNVEWGKMEFTYTTAGVKTWDAQNHTYSVQDPTGGWAEDGNTVKVTNHSNVVIEAAFSYEKGTETTLDGTFAYDKTAASNVVTLNAGVENQKDSADSVTATLTLSGTPGKTLANFTEVGNVVVKITK